MADLSEVVDLRVDSWGQHFNSAGERFRHTEKLIAELGSMRNPIFDQEPWSPARTYKPFTFVHDDVGDTYVSIDYVPSGKFLDNPLYWVHWEMKDEELTDIRKDLNDVMDEVSNIHTITVLSSEDLEKLKNGEYE